MVTKRFPVSLSQIITTIKTTSVGDASSVGDGLAWLAGDTDGLAGNGGRF